MAPERVKLPHGYGRVLATPSGEPTVCEFGLAIRLGLAAPTAEHAARVYPAIELLPGERRADPGEMLEGLAVFAWVGNKYLAELTGASERTVRDWIHRGLPCRARRGGREYPVPHAIVWEGEYRRAVLANVGRCDYLPFQVALARQRLRELEHEMAAGP